MHHKELRGGKHAALCSMGQGNAHILSHRNHQALTVLKVQILSTLLFKTMSKEQKPDARIGVTTRYTQEELNKLDWLAERLGCDRANAPRHLMSGYLVAHADLAEQYDRSKEAGQ